MKYTDPTAMKRFLIQYKYIKLNVDGLMLSEKTLRGDLVCYIYNITITYDYFYLKTARVETVAAVTKDCSVARNGYNYEQQESRNMFLVQLLFGLFFLYKGVKTWFDLVRIIERINIKLRDPSIGGPAEDIELDFNFYRFMLSRNIKSTIITRKDLKYFSTGNICRKLIRPLYYVCLFGYIVQAFASAYNLYGVYFMDEVTQAQLNLTAIAIMCSWIDLYTITSQSNESGLVNDTFLQVYKQFLSFTAYILVVMIAFSAFALCIFNESIYFNNLVNTLIALFAFMYGDNIRATFLTYQYNPFSVIFLVSVIIVLFSCLAQFYLAVFTIKFQTTSDKANKMISMMNRHKEGFIRMQREIIESKSKHFGDEINYLMDYLDKKSKIVRTTTLDERTITQQMDIEEIDEPDLLPPKKLSRSGKKVSPQKMNPNQLKKKALDEDTMQTFNEAEVPAHQLSLLRRT